MTIQHSDSFEAVLRLWSTENLQALRQGFIMAGCLHQAMDDEAHATYCRDQIALIDRELRRRQEES